MAVHIRLARQGTKKKPFYRVVVTDQRSPRGGRFLENIGTFDPSPRDLKTKEQPLNIDLERFAYWKGNGAVPSATLERLIKRAAKAQAASPPPAAK
jgi:small subunit ribosomal protein S16